MIYEALVTFKRSSKENGGMKTYSLVMTTESSQWLKSLLIWQLVCLEHQGRARSHLSRSRSSSGIIPLIRKGNQLVYVLRMLALAQQPGYPIRPPLQYSFIDELMLLDHTELLHAIIMNSFTDILLINFQLRGQGRCGFCRVIIDHVFKSIGKFWCSEGMSSVLMGYPESCLSVLSLSEYIASLKFFFAR